MLIEQGGHAASEGTRKTFCYRALKDRCYRRARGKIRSMPRRTTFRSFRASWTGARSRAESDLLRSADANLPLLERFRATPDGMTNDVGAHIGASPRNSSPRSKAMPSRRTRTLAARGPTSRTAPLEVPEQVSDAYDRERQDSAIARSQAAVGGLPLLPLVKGVHCMSHRVVQSRRGVRHPTLSVGLLTVT